MLLFRSLGFGYFTAHKSRSQWASDFLDWLDKYTFYRPYDEIWQSFSHQFPRISRIEDEYLAYRLRDCNQARLAIVVRLPGFNHSVKWLYKKLGGLAVLCEKGA